jgi:hypothetical protein
MSAAKGKKVDVKPDKTVIKALALGGLLGGGGECAVDVKDGKVVRIRPFHYDWKYNREQFRPWKITRNGKTYRPLFKSVPGPFSLAYKKRTFSPNRIKWIFRSLYAIFTRKYWMDDLYENLIAGNLLYRGLFQAFQWLDKIVIGGAANGIAYVTTGASRTARRIQTGQIQLYAVVAVIGIVIIALIALVRG